MPHTHWTDAEKKIARRVFEAALQRELAALMADFKQRAAQATEPENLWEIQEFLARARREIDARYDYRYSQLDLVFARLLFEKRIEEHELAGLGQDKLATILRIASL